MNKQTISQALMPTFRAYNVQKAVLFGSYAKGTATEKSDVDLYVDSGLHGLKFVGFTEKLRNALGGKDVDVLDSAHISPNSKILKEIETTGVLVYER